MPSSSGLFRRSTSPSVKKHSTAPGARANVVTWRSGDIGDADRRIDGDLGQDTTPTRGRHHRREMARR